MVKVSIYCIYTTKEKTYQRRVMDFALMKQPTADMKKELETYKAQKSEKSS